MQKQTSRLNGYKKNLRLSKSIKRNIRKLCRWCSDKEEYLSYKAEYKSRIKISGRRFIQNKRKTALERQKNLMKLDREIYCYGTLSEVTREIVTELIEKIVANGDKSIDIVFKYQSPYPVENRQCKDQKFFYSNFP